MLSFKNVRETDNTHAHVNVYNNSEYIGYITSPKVNPIMGLWYFTSKTTDFKNQNAKTKTELIEKIAL